MMQRISALMLICFLVSVTMDAQISGNNPYLNTTLPDTSSNDSDTSIVKNGFLSLFKGKPGKAALYGLLIPSGGQIYNKKWWKVPLALGVDGGLTYVLISNRKGYRTSQNNYIAALKQDPAPSNINLLREQRDYFRKWSEYAWIWLIAGHLLTVVDAYVDRHLMDFDVSDDLTYIPGNAGNSFPLMLKTGIKIPLNHKPRSTINPLYPVIP